LKHTSPKNIITVIFISLLAIAFIFTGCSLQGKEKNIVLTSDSNETIPATEINTTAQQNNPAEEEATPEEKREDGLPREEEII
jgi:PBP1b-binding outer membrane lipoprotein LpoB